MEAKELRIGNWVTKKINSGIGLQHVHPIGWQDIVRVYEGSELFEYEPIPLTEEWLLKAGAKKDNEYFEINRFDISYMPIDEKWLFTDFNFGYFYATIKYVHELQNLVFALDKTELTFQ